MNQPTNNQGAEFTQDSKLNFNNLPSYIPEIGNESGINYRSVEIKSHSFEVSSTRHLAGENIIFEPGDFRDDNR